MPRKTNRGAIFFLSTAPAACARRTVSKHTRTCGKRKQDKGRRVFSHGEPGRSGGFGTKNPQSPSLEPGKTGDFVRKKHRFRPIKTGHLWNFKKFSKKGVDGNGESAYSVQHLNGLCRESGR